MYEDNFFTHRIYRICYIPMLIALIMIMFVINSAVLLNELNFRRHKLSETANNTS